MLWRLSRFEGPFWPSQWLVWLRSLQSFLPAHDLPLPCLRLESSDRAVLRPGDVEPQAKSSLVLCADGSLVLAQCAGLVTQARKLRQMRDAIDGTRPQNRWSGCLNGNPVKGRLRLCRYTVASLRT